MIESRPSALIGIDGGGTSCRFGLLNEGRRTEHRAIVAFTDALARGFALGPRWLGCLRTGGMLALDLLPVARHVLARHAMGLASPQARLVRGLNP